LPSDRILVIGAGLSGATAARTLAEAGFSVVVMERHAHPGGHCHTYRDTETGIMLHAHGPHILHSDDAETWAFIERFAVLRPYVHTVQAVTGGRHYSLPITLATIRQFFGRDFNPSQAQQHLAALRRSYPHEPANFEEQGRALVGDALYEAFFEGYTRKQWGTDPSALPASLLRRIPVRFSEDQSYFHHARAAIPEAGYTALIAAILEHPAIEVTCNAEAGPAQAAEFRHCIYTGALDAWFGNRFGRLGYRSLEFDIRRSTGSMQPVAQVNYCDMSVPWTRIVEYKHFTPWERHEKTVFVYETSRACGPGDTPYYPMRLNSDMPVVARYLETAERCAGVSFVGRLATYRYIDMDVAIGEALAAGSSIAAALKAGAVPPSLFSAKL
jgi:UDP-galactopyranose mutase